MPDYVVFDFAAAIIAISFGIWQDSISAGTFVFGLCILALMYGNFFFR